MIVLQNIDVDVDQVWENMVGGHSGYWADSYRTLDNKLIEFYKNGNYDEPNPQDFKILADGKWYTITMSDLCEAYVKLKSNGWTHCGGESVDDEDACTGDAILQVAAFGEFVYG